MNWRQYFQGHILERGLNYYLDERVISFEMDSNVLSAKVSGNEDYLVEAHFENSKLVTLICDCPHAAGGYFCKHMAATMYAYENQEKRPSNLETKKTVEDYINEADEQIVRSFLKDVLLKDSYLLKQFVTALGRPITTIDLERFRNELSHIFSDYLYPNGFIEYDEAWDFQVDLERYMRKTIKELLIENGYFKEAFKLTNEVFLALIELPIDDSAGTITDIAVECVEIWEKILDECDVSLKKEIFAWFWNQLEIGSLDYLEDYIEEILFSSFQEDEFLEEKEKLAREKFNYYKFEKSSFFSKYNAEKWAMYYLQSLNQIEDIIAFCETNLEYMDVRVFYVDHLIQTEEFEKAISLFEEVKNQDSSEAKLSKESSEKLMTLYAKTENNLAYLEELYQLVTSYGSQRMDLFEKYRSLFKEEEWLEKRGPLINDISVWNGKDKLLLEEEMYDELLEVVIQTSGLDLLRKHQELLYKVDADKVLSKYETEILKSSEMTSNRKTYQAIVSNIREIKYLSNNNPRIDELVNFLKKTYKRRPAMMDELSRL